MADSGYDLRTELLETLEYQRASARAVVEGLSEELWRKAVLPSGWTVAGMIGHLGNMERHWFQGVIADADGDQPWDEGLPPYDPAASFSLERPSAEIARELLDGKTDLGLR